MRRWRVDLSAAGGEAQAGDLLLVAPGEVVLVDALVERDIAILDESALTGEPLRVERCAGNLVGLGSARLCSPRSSSTST